MIIVLKQDAPDAQVREFCHELQDMGLQINDSKGSDTHILGLIGDTKAIAESWVLANPVVETCRRVSEPYKKANRKFHPDDSVIDVNGVKIGGGNFAVIAGPCSIESEEQITYCAQRVKAAGASLLRGGAFKPRTSPYSFQGMRSEGLDLLKLARRATGSPIVTEIMNTEHLPLFENVDLIQVGARNMQNFELLKAVGRQKKPVLLKRGLANTLEEFVMSAEYIMAEGNENVILCERGIRTFETSMRNTLDLAGVVMLHKMTHLPVVVDPSHACGHAWMVPQLAKAAVAAGADGLMIEVHNNPAKAKCDGAQSLTPDQFDTLETRYFYESSYCTQPECRHPAGIGLEPFCRRPGHSGGDGPRFRDEAAAGLPCRCRQDRGPAAGRGGSQNHPHSGAGAGCLSPGAGAGQLQG